MEEHYPDLTAREVAHDAAQWIVGVLRSKNFWLYLAAIVALRAYLSSLEVFAKGSRYDQGWSKFKYYWEDAFGVIFDHSLLGSTLLSENFVPYFLFIGFCLIMNAIRKSEQ